MDRHVYPWTVLSAIQLNILFSPWYIYNCKLAYLVLNNIHSFTLILLEFHYLANCNQSSLWFILLKIFHFDWKKALLQHALFFLIGYNFWKIFCLKLGTVKVGAKLCSNAVGKVLHSTIFISFWLNQKHGHCANWNQSL